MVANNELIAGLSDIIAKLARGELVALEASVGHDTPSVVYHRPLGAAPIRYKSGPAVITLELRMEQVPRKADSADTIRSKEEIC